MNNSMRFVAAATLVLAIGIGAATQPASASQKPVQRAVAAAPISHTAATSLRAVPPTAAPTAIDHAVEPPASSITRRAVPAIVVYAVYLIVRFGIPWLIRYAYGVFTSVFLSQSIKTMVCQKLRDMGNPWGWSSYCPR